MMTSQSTKQLPIDSLPIEKHVLDPPPLSAMIPIISKRLQANYKTSTISIVHCPDLTKPPFHLAALGLSGNESIADIGGPSFLHPLPDFSKKYSLPDIISACSKDNQEKGAKFAIGAGAGPFHIVGQNSELAPNLSISKNGGIMNLTKYAKIGSNSEVVSGPVPEGSTDCALMANLFISSGISGDVLKITARGRIGETKSFTECIQSALTKEYGERCVSMGGVFLLKKGKARMHVMPDFSKEPLGQEDMANWLRFFEMEAELVCLTTFHSHDPGLGLRMEHTHCFAWHDDGKEGKGGHYHGDTDETREEVEYEAYFNVARIIYRIDRPTEAHE